MNRKKPLNISTANVKLKISLKSTEKPKQDHNLLISSKLNHRILEVKFLNHPHLQKSILFPLGRQLELPINI